MAKWYLAGVFLIIFFGAVSVYAQECTDSDSGSNYFIKGTTEDKGISKTDECYFDSSLGKTLLMEYACYSNELTEHSIDCGGNGCENGACIVPETDIKCLDSENGMSYYIKGETTGYDPTVEGLGSATDQCSASEPGVLIESYCGKVSENSNEILLQQRIKCPDGCRNGACIGECTDSDGGIKPNIQGITIGVNDIGDSKTSTDFCSTENLLTEYYCNENGAILSTDNYCSNGCLEGQCLPLKIIPEKSPVDLPLEDDRPISELPKKDNLPVISAGYICQGCESESKCYPFGYRKEGQYCTDSGNFSIQKTSNELCDNNFECTSNFCVSGKCIDPGLLEQIISWFKKFFGMA